MSTYKELWQLLEHWLDQRAYYSNTSTRSVLDKMRELERTSIHTKEVHFRSPRIKRKEKSEGEINEDKS